MFPHLIQISAQREFRLSTNGDDTAFGITAAADIFQRQVDIFYSQRNQFCYTDACRIQKFQHSFIPHFLIFITLRLFQKQFHLLQRQDLGDLLFHLGQFHICCRIFHYNAFSKQKLKKRTNRRNVSGHSCPCLMLLLQFINIGHYICTVHLRRILNTSFLQKFTKAFQIPCVGKNGIF